MIARTRPPAPAVYPHQHFHGGLRCCPHQYFQGAVLRCPLRCQRSTAACCPPRCSSYQEGIDMPYELPAVSIWSYISSIDFVPSGPYVVRNFCLVLPACGLPKQFHLSAHVCTLSTEYSWKSCAFLNPCQVDLSDREIVNTV